MATLLKLLYSSKLAQFIGWPLFGWWVFIDFNDLKMMVLGIMAMIWATGHGLLSLYRMWIKAQREKIELDRFRKEKDKII